jgi:hypothetical protein
MGCWPMGCSTKYRNRIEMIRNEVDDFRAAFFDRVVQVEQERERAVRRKQANCFHRYVPSGPSGPSGPNGPKASLSPLGQNGTVSSQQSQRAIGPVVEPFVALQCVLCQHTIVRHRKPK